MSFWITTKTYTHSDGLSCCYRQWRATNCNRFLHGYALSFKLVFECHQLDTVDATMDSANLHHVKDWLTTQFGNTVIVATDDPELEMFKQLAANGAADLRVLPGVGCEKFAEHVFIYVMTWLIQSGSIQRVTIRSVECIEHDGNSALYVE